MDSDDGSPTVHTNINCKHKKSILVKSIKMETNYHYVKKIKEMNIE